MVNLLLTIDEVSNRQKFPRTSVIKTEREGCMGNLLLTVDTDDEWG
jgi:hypothetical protein